MPRKRFLDIATKHFLIYFTQFLIFGKRFFLIVRTYFLLEKNLAVGESCFEKKNRLRLKVGRTVTWM